MRSYEKRSGIMKPAGGYAAIVFLALAVQLSGAANAQERAREAIIEGAKKEGKLQIYALLAVPEHMQIIQRFKEKYPFIEPALYRATSERLYSRIETEARAGSHLVDVIGVSGFQFYQLMKRGLMGKYDSPERKFFEPAFRDKDGLWTAYYINPLVTAFNTRQLKPQEAPKSYDELVEPKWKSKLVMEDEEIEWFATMMSFWGEEKALAYMRRLAAQNYVIRHGHTLMTQLVAAGEYPAAVLVYAPQTESIRNSGAPIDWHPLNPTVAGTNLMGIAAKAPHPNAAMLYIDHMLSEEIQKEYLSAKFFKVSARRGIPSTVAKKLSSVKVISADMTQSEHFETQRKRFREIFMGGR
jgi:iron(III) transport system substrate-binding protein